MRQYQPIWEAIKRNNHASIVAPISNHRRIIKAVQKEKYNDTAYKDNLYNKGLKAELVISKHADNPTQITFSLQTHLAKDNIGVHIL